MWRAEQVFIVETLRNVRHACSSVLHNPVRHIVLLSFLNARIETRSYLENIILHFRYSTFFVLAIVTLSSKACFSTFLLVHYDIFFAAGKSASFLVRVGSTVRGPLEKSSSLWLSSSDLWPRDATLCFRLWSNN